MARKRLLIFLGSLLVINCIEANPAQREYRYYPATNGWLKLHLEPATWREARQTCFKEDAVLASPENEDLEKAIREVLSQSQTPLKVYTGVHDTYATGHFYSMEGTRLSSMPVYWVHEEPVNGSRTQNCLHLTTADNYESEMIRGSCSEVLPFVCFTRNKPDVVDCGIDKDYKYEARTNRCYKFHTDKKNWSAAFATCSDEGSHLALINSATEAQVFRELYAKANATSAKPLYEVIFLGFTDIGDHNRTWMTIHGQTLKAAGYDKWEPGQPADKLSPCGAMYGKDGLLDDYWCAKSCSFICELDPQNHVDIEDDNVAQTQQLQR